MPPPVSTVLQQVLSSRHPETAPLLGLPVFLHPCAHATYCTSGVQGQLGAPSRCRRTLVLSLGTAELHHYLLPAGKQNKCKAGRGLYPSLPGNLSASWIYHGRNHLPLQLHMKKVIGSIFSLQIMCKLTDSRDKLGHS